MNEYLSLVLASASQPHLCFILGALIWIVKMWQEIRNMSQSDVRSANPIKIKY